jgi:hypothetical protein
MVTALETSMYWCPVVEAISMGSMEALKNLFEIGAEPVDIQQEDARRSLRLFQAPRDGSARALEFNNTWGGAKK